MVKRRSSFIKLCTNCKREYSWKPPKKGWEKLTDEAIKSLSKEREHIVFILWGRYAQEKESLIDTKKHFIIKSPHPSPFSAHKGFFGSKPFSKSNDFLQSFGISPVNWSLVNQ